MMNGKFFRRRKSIWLFGLLVIGVLTLAACEPAMVALSPTPTELEVTPGPLAETPPPTPTPIEFTPTPTPMEVTPTPTLPDATPTPLEATPTSTPTEPVPAPAEEVEVAVRDNRFDPADLTVPVGATVIWTNQGFLPHTVTADDGSFDSGTLGRGDTFEMTFTEPGTYSYHCEIHGGTGGLGMAGAIIVTE
jgi:plastocyanin